MGSAPAKMCRLRDIVAARLDRLAIDKVDAARQQGFQRRFEIDEAREIVPLGGELDQEIDIAPRRVEVIAARRRAENLQPPDVETAAQGLQLGAVP
jgi:hypothetical protein